MKYAWIASLALGYCLASSSVFASVFSNQFIEVELPDKWQCHLENIEWICEDPTNREAVLIMAAKAQSKQESMEHYLAYLKVPVPFSSPIDGKLIKPKVLYTKEITLQGQPWIDSLQAESEVSGTYTRYFGSVQQNTAVLVTFTVNQKEYKSYLPVIDNLLKTMRVSRKSAKNSVTNPSDIAKPSQTNPVQIPVVPEAVIAGDKVQGGSDEPKPAPIQKAQLPIGMILFGIAAVVGVIVLKRRKS